MVFFIASLIIEALLLARPNPFAVVVLLGILSALAAGVYKKGAPKLKGWALLLSILLQIAVTGYGFCNWGQALTGFEQEIDFLNYAAGNAPWTFAVALCAGLCGYHSLRVLLASLLQQEESALPQQEGFSTRQRWLLCFMCALIPISFCSESSFLYPLNDWVDVSCFLTVGKSWMHGLVPYRDLIEQKGPYLYLLYGLASLITPSSYVGAWLLEVGSGTVFLYYADRTACLYMGEDRKKEFFLVPLFAVLTFTSSALFCGGSTEEFTLPMLMYATYRGLQTVKEGAAPGIRQWVPHGIFVGLILWSKFTILGYYIGWVLFFGAYLLRKGGFREVLRMAGGLLIGFMLATLPVLLYFGLTGALGQLFEIYFYDNIFLYPDISEGSPLTALLSHYLRGGELMVMKNIWTVLLLGLFLNGLQDRKESLLLLSCAGCLFLSSFIGKWTWGFYTLVFTPLAAAGLGCLMRRWQVKRMRILPVLVLLLFTALLTPNRLDMLKKREDTHQHQFASIVRQTENPTLLVYDCLDDGFYLAADILPTCRAFCGLASPIPDVAGLQRESIEKGLTDYVVAWGGCGPLYEEVASGNGFRLYKLIE